MNRPVGLASFDDQSRLAHALAVAAAVGAFCLGYFGSAVVLHGDAAVLAGGDPGPNRAASACGAALSSATLSVAFVRGYGGPVLNPFVYPLVVFGLAPVVGRLLAFGPGAALRGDPLAFTLEPLVTTLVALGAAALVFLAALATWAATLEEADRRAWERRHLPAEFYEAFVAEEREPGPETADS